MSTDPASQQVQALYRATQWDSGAISLVTAVRIAGNIKVEACLEQQLADVSVYTPVNAMTSARLRSWSRVLGTAWLHALVRSLLGR